MPEREIVYIITDDDNFIWGVYKHKDMAIAGAKEFRELDEDSFECYEDVARYVDWYYLN